MKKMFLPFVFVAIVLNGCSISSQGEIHQAQTKFEEEQVNPVKKLVVQSGYDIFSFSQPSQCMGIVVNAQDLYTFAYRLGGDNVGVKKESELPFLQEKQEEGTSEHEFTYIRLVQTPFIPEVGMNAFPRKDIVIYLDPEHPNDAFVGAQNPNKLDEWQIYRVSDYGKWLEKEIDLYIALYTGL